MSFLWSDASSDLFLQTLLQGETLNDEFLFLETPQAPPTVLCKSESNDSSKLKQQNMEFRQMMEKEDHYPQIPDSFANEQELLGQSMNGNSLQTTVLKPNYQDKIPWQCPYLAESRKIKIERYKQKKCKRTWQKKVTYDCRKVMAYNRLRIKGRFVKKESPQPSIAESSTQMQAEERAIPIEQQKLLYKMDSSSFFQF